MTAKTMAEVLAEHSNLEWSFEYGGFICAECGWQETYALPYEQDAEAGARDAHQAAALSAAGFGVVADAKAPEVRYATLTSGETELDEVVARNASVHLEAMDDNHWWLLVESGGETVHVNFYTKRAKISGHAEVDS